MGKRKKGYPATLDFSENADSVQVIKVKVKKRSKLAGLGDTIYITKYKSDKTLDELMNINNIESNGNK